MKALFAEKISARISPFQRSLEYSGNDRQQYDTTHKSVKLIRTDVSDYNYQHNRFDADTRNGIWTRI